ncbi:hypothetical protein [Fusibacter sp. 3D3]|uniref:hypothetical protein n=1 Tax=Fusibacter sp. 3D3 TaxID=1048380 RepID=UPI000853DF23|nr:hypothetical protein [Fusibacter sp. 3D3]GAU78536.1 hypothetical protein F3D3_3170 [Fusibacter sp. 3D3]
MSKNKFTMTRLGHQYKTKNRNKNYILELILLMLLIVLIFDSYKGFDNYIREILQIKSYSSENISTWISSLSSYWGGILGGLVSGIISFFGILITIRYYRSNDVINKILENQPFLNLKVVSVLNSNDNNLLKNDYLCELGIGKHSVDVLIEIENIGKNFARTLVYHNGNNIGGFAFNHVINSGMKLDRTVYIKVNFNDFNEIKNFQLQYFDCFMTEYIQNFTFNIKNQKEKLSIECDYPIEIDRVLK